jgi:hypothetical protein
LRGGEDFGGREVEKKKIDGKVYGNLPLNLMMY